jgi:hypothetical protein
MIDLKILMISMPSQCISSEKYPTKQNKPIQNIPKIKLKTNPQVPKDSPAKTTIYKNMESTSPQYENTSPSSNTSLNNSYNNTQIALPE